MIRSRHLAPLILAAGALCSAAFAGLPPPTPAQAAAAAEKKAAADLQAQKDKEALVATMDRLTARWRGRAASEGWPVHAPVAIAAPAAALTAPAKLAGANGQPDGKLGDVAAATPVRSEKAGTAAPSADIKKQPSPVMRTQERK